MKKTKHQFALKNIVKGSTALFAVLLFIFSMSNISANKDDNQINTTSESGQYIYDFEYTGEEQVKFIIPETGNYTVEAWGAQGGSRESGIGGKGGYVSGNIELVKGQETFITVGGEGNTSVQGFNGGGTSAHNAPLIYGGGATDIRVGGTDFLNRILVAAGGGASSERYDGGYGGGATGGDGGATSASYRGLGASQSATAGNRPGAFGRGGNGIRGSNSYSYGGGGGGGGWYGGGGGYEYSHYRSSGGGGSSYILTPQSFRPSFYNPENKYLFKDATMLSGNENFFNKDGIRVTGQEGNGFLRFTLNHDINSTEANLKDIKIDNKTILGFRSDKYEYEVDIDAEFSLSKRISVTKNHFGQDVDGDGVIDFDYGNKTHIIRVYSADRNTRRDYTIRFNRAPSTKLYSLDFEGMNFKGADGFSYDVFDYQLDTFKNKPVTANFQTFTKEANVKIEGLDNIQKGDNKITLTVSLPNNDIEATVYNINLLSHYAMDFTFENREEVFIVPHTGTYKLEAWGGQGGSREDGTGGLGGYVSGEVNLTKGEKLYLNVGGEGSPEIKGYNGGGSSAHNAPIIYGGGASDVRIGNNGLYNRILVAAGGGASSERYNGGDGGGTVGEDGNATSASYKGLGASQSATAGSRPGGFGYGGNGLRQSTGYPYGGGGGGGGWYGGGGGYEYSHYRSSGGGGSSYILTKDSHKPANYEVDSKYQMKNPDHGVIGDYESNTWTHSFLDVDGKLVSGHEGNGHIRFTYYTDEMKSSANLRNISFNGIPIEDFISDKTEYTIMLEPDYVGTDKISVQKTLDSQTVIGAQEIELTAGDYKHTIIVTASDLSKTETYTINFRRDNTSKLLNLQLDGYLFKGGEGFKDDVYEYEVDAFQNEEITLSYETYNDDSQVEIKGLDDLGQSENLIEVLVTTPGAKDQVYKITVNRMPTIEYAYVGAPQVFVVPHDGKYKVEMWGASGGSREADILGGGGGFVGGEINLKQGEELYLYVGGEGTLEQKGYNGGGQSAHNAPLTYGGGATDIRIDGHGVYNKLMVAAGGGAGSTRYVGGAGGGLQGEDGNATSASYKGLGASQSATAGSRPGGFGYGGNGLRQSTGYPYGGGGGGGGWYGGGGGYEYSHYRSSGGGGSSYILTKDSHRPANFNPDDKYIFENPDFGDRGNKELGTWEQSFIDTDGKRVESHQGEGLIRITFYSDEVLSSTQVNYINLDGKKIEGFKPDVREYDIEIDGEFYDDVEFTLSKVHTDQVIVGKKDLKISHHNQSHKFSVKSADGKYADDYVINFIRKASSKLQHLTVDGYDHAFTETFDKNIYSYDLKSYVYGGVNVKYTTFDENATVKVVGANENELRPGNNKIVVTVSSLGKSDTIYEINAYRQRDMNFGYTGKQETFNIPYTGIYQFELWGAQGGGREEGIGGKGAYTSAELYLRKDEVVYVNVGGEGSPEIQGYNGGGNSAHNDPVIYGGGATDIQFGGKGASYRTIVAAGGGASSQRYDGGYAGGEVGGDGNATSATYKGLGASQTATAGSRPGGFGYGGNGLRRSTGYPYGGGGGGGGWFGGGGGYEYSHYYASGGGGSSYVYTQDSPRPANYAPSPKYYGANPIMLSGIEEMPGKEGFTVRGNEGNGFAKISLMNLYSTDSRLSYLKFSGGASSNQTFDPDTYAYDVVLDSNQTQLTISADTIDNNAEVIWDSDKVLTINPGTTYYELLVIAQDGGTKVYTIRVHRQASVTSLLSDLTVDGETIKDFDPTTLEYTLNLTYDQSRYIDLGWTKSRPAQIITGDNEVTLENNVPISIIVISEDGNNTSEYQIMPIIEDSNLLKSVVIDELDFEFDENTFEYDLIVPSGISSLNINAVAYDHEAKVSITGNGYLRNGVNVVEIIVDEPYTEIQKYILNVTRSDSADGSVNKEYDFAYKGEVQYFEAPHTGNFQLETWGAEGGNRGSASGGKGGYSKGIVRLTRGEMIAVYVGGAGTSTHKGFNGGGISGTANVYGGGASDVRVGKYSLNERIIVAGGGGSVGATNKPGAAGGGLVGISNNYSYGSGGQGGTQTAAGRRGSFGIGGNGLYQSRGRSGAGGGGWYGGGGATPDYSGDDDRGGGGGSGYLLTKSSIKPDGYNVSSKYYLSDTETIAGNRQLPDKSGGYVTGNSGNGFVRVTALRRASTDNHLSIIELNGSALLEPEFDLETYEYNINLEPAQSELTIKGIPMDPLATIVGNGTYSIPATGKTLDLFVTSESGDTLTYNLEINRLASSDGLPKDIVITGLVPSLCEVSDEYCKLSPKFVAGNLDNDRNAYYTMTVPSRIESVEFSVIKNHEYQTVLGGGVKTLNPGDGNETFIWVESEDESVGSSYTFDINRDMTGNADLKLLNIIYPQRDLEFNTDITEYYMSVENEIDDTSKIEWKVEPMDPEANLKIAGQGPLALGTNEIEFKVIAKNGQIKNYKLFVYREDNSNTFLEKLVLFNNEDVFSIAPSFNKTINNYVLTVENEIDFVDIIAKAEEVETTTVINGDEGRHQLTVGQNIIKIITNAEDGSTNVYSLTVIKKASNKKDIQNIILNGESVEGFDANELSQTFIVDSQITRPIIEIQLDDEFASYSISGSYTRFNPGLNPVYIRVTAENGSTKTYSFIFDKEISNNSQLASVSSTMFDLSDRFDPEVVEYDITLPYSEEKMSISGKASKHTSKVLNSGEYYLSSGLNEIKLEVVAEDNSTTVYTFNVNILPNTNAELKALNSDVGILDPKFESNKYSYTINVDNETKFISLAGIPTVESTKVVGLGEHALKIGLNEIEVKTTAESGSKLTYNISVIRDASKNTNLAYLVVHEGALSREFDPGIIEYDLNVGNNVRSLTIETAVENSAANYKVINADNLTVGLNRVVIRVTPKVGDGFKDYILNVYVQQPASENINLSELKISSGKLKPDFLPQRQFFRTEVANEVTSVMVNGFASDGVEVIGNGKQKLKVGRNIVVITTKAKNGVTKDYQVEVNRAKSADARLSRLSVGGLINPIRFSSNNFNYNGSTYRSNLSVVATPINANATYEVLGNDAFVTNNKTIVIIRVTAEDGISTQDYILNISKIASKNNNLAKLSVSGVSFSPNFTPSRTTYTASVGEAVNQVVVSAEAEDINAKIEMDKVCNLSVGRNFIDVNVRAENNAVRKYTIQIDKEGSKIRDLAAITIDGISIDDFDKDIQNYSLDYPFEKESIFVDYELVDQKSLVTGAGEIKLAVGMNKLPIIVTSENGETKTYNLNVLRKEINSAEIKSLDIDQYVLDNGFDPNIFTYNLFVDNEFESLQFNVSLKDPKATIETVGNKNFQSGNNVVKLKVISSEQDQINTYTFNVTRQDFANNTLAYLSLDDGNLKSTPQFAPLTMVYHVEVSHEKEEIKLHGVAENASSNVSGLGIKPLEYGVNHFEIPVQSHGKIVRKYHVFVNRSRSNDNTLTSLSIESAGDVLAFTPAFDPKVNEYTLSEDIGAGTQYVNFNVQSVAKNIKGSGQQNIKVGNNKLEIIVTSDSGLENIYTINLNRIASTNNNLVGIAPTAGSLTPNFIYSEDNYKLNVDTATTSLAFNVQTEDRNATVLGHHRELVDVGESIRTITVKAESGDIKTYTIKVNKRDTNNVSLTNLKVKGFELEQEFNSNLYTYDLVVPNSKQVLHANEVLVTTEDENATVVKTGSLTLLTGELANVYEVRVTAVDGHTSQTYRINIIREASSEALIKKIRFNQGTLNRSFNAYNFEYDIEFTSDVSLFNKNNIIDLETTDSKATVTYSHNDDIHLKEGEITPFVITIESEDRSSKQTYTFNLTYVRSKDSRLSDILIEEGQFTPAFSPDTFNYDVDIDEHTNSIVVKAFARDPKGKIISVLGDKELVNVTTLIEIKVQAESGAISTYKLNVRRSLTHSIKLKDIQLTDAQGEQLQPDFNDIHSRYEAVVAENNDYAGLIVKKGHESQQIKLSDKYDNEVDLNRFELDRGRNTFRLDVKSSYDDARSIYISIFRGENGNTNLSSLEVVGHDLDLQFDKDTLSYSIEVDNLEDEVIINATPEIQSSSVQIINNHFLKEGNNEVIVRVTAENGDSKDYIVHVFRKAKFNSFLETITISDGKIISDDIKFFTPYFNKGTTNYTVSVPATTKSLLVEGVAQLPSETIITTKVSDPETVDKIVENGVQINLKAGSNVVQFTVLNTEGGTTLIYTINIVREMSSDVNLSGLVVEAIDQDKVDVLNLSPQFKPEINHYNVDVGPEVDNVTVTATSENMLARVKITGNENLFKGENLVKVTITSEDRTKQKVYTIVVNKTLAKDNDLTSLNIKHSDQPIHEFDLNEEKLTYFVAKDVNEVIVGGSAKDPLAHINGLGSYYVQHGENEIVVSVRAQSGDVKDYVIKVFREHNNDLQSLTISEGDLEPEFNPNKKNYVVWVPLNVDRIYIEGIAANRPVAIVKNNGAYDLDVGSNHFEIIVESALDSQATTNIEVIRSASPNVYLQAIYLDQGRITPKFERDKFNYDTYINESNNKIDLTIVTEDKKATYEILEDEEAQFIVTKNKDNVTISNLDKKSEITIRVTAENGDTKDTTLTVHREPASVFSNKLKSLESSINYNPSFSPDENIYIINVDETVNSIMLKGIAQSKDATIQGNGTFEVKSGNNRYDITVTSKDGKENNYQVRVRRYPSSDPTLKNLTFKEGFLTPIFDRQNKGPYTLNVGATTNYVTPTIIPNAQGTTWEIAGGSDLKIGQNNVLTIDTLAANGTTKDKYTVNINKTNKSSAYLQALIPSVGNFDQQFNKYQEGPYVLEVPANTNTVNLKAIAEEPESVDSIIGAGIVDMTNSNNKRVEIIVNGKAKNTMVYYVEIIKTLDDDVRLNYLNVTPGQLEPTFTQDLSVYNVVVGTDVEEIEIQANTSGPAFIDGIGRKSLNPGLNVFMVTLTTDLGSVGVYTINVQREMVKSADIIELRFKEALIETPHFDKEHTEYDLYVPFEVKELTIDHILLEDPINAEATLEQEEFVVGPNNKVMITVTNSELDIDNTKTYTFNVTRYANTSNYLKALATSPYVAPLIQGKNPNEGFVKTVNNYELTIPYEVSEVTFTGAPETANETSVSGLGTAAELKVGITEHKIIVTNNITGIPRTYIVRINRLEDSSNDLLSLDLIGGVINPQFGASELDEYTVNVDFDVDKVTFNGTHAETATAVGLETVAITDANIKHQITITAQNGEEKTYKFTIRKELSSNANVLNIQPSNDQYNIEPQFDEITKAYTVLVPDEVNRLGFDVTVVNKFAKISGDEEKQLVYGENHFTIKVVSEDGANENIYEIVVFRERDIKSLEIKPDNVVMSVGESKDLELIIGPEDVTNKEVMWESNNDEIVTVDDTGKITAVNVGSVQITVSSKKNPQLKSTAIIEVLSLKLESEVLDIVRGELEDSEIKDYVIGSKDRLTIDEYLELFTNERSTLKVFDLEGFEIASDEINVGTSMRLKLVVNGQVYDEVNIIVRGDVDGNGIINVNDFAILQDILLKKYNASEIQLTSLDLDNNGVTNVNDFAILQEFLLKKITDLNRYGDK